jgi:hypothetical protein
MKRFATNIALYLVLFLVGFFLVPFAQHQISGAVDATTNLLCLFVLLPTLYLILGWYLGRKTLHLHLVLYVMHLISAFLIFIKDQPGQDRDFNNALAPSWFVCILLTVVFRSIFVKSSFKE